MKNDHVFKKIMASICVVLTSTMGSSTYGNEKRLAPDAFQISMMNTPVSVESHYQEDSNEPNESGCAVSLCCLFFLSASVLAAGATMVAVDCSTGAPCEDLVEIGRVMVWTGGLGSLFIFGLAASGACEDCGSSEDGEP